jgi:hypothetical protein
MAGESADACMGCGDAGRIGPGLPSTAHHSSRDWVRSLAARTGLHLG